MHIMHIYMYIYILSLHIKNLFLNSFYKKFFNITIFLDLYESNVLIAIKIAIINKINL